MILQPLIASLNPESLSMPTGTLRNKDASLSTFSLSTNSFSLPLYLSVSLSLSSLSFFSTFSISFLALSASTFDPFSVSIAINASLTPFTFRPVETKNAHCGPDRWCLMSGIRFRPVEQSFVLIGNDATSLSRQRFPPLRTPRYIHAKRTVSRTIKRQPFNRLRNDWFLESGVLVLRFESVHSIRWRALHWHHLHQQAAVSSLDMSLRNGKRTKIHQGNIFIFLNSVRFSLISSTFEEIVIKFFL